MPYDLFPTVAPRGAAAPRGARPLDPSGEGGPDRVLLGRWRVIAPPSPLASGELAPVREVEGGRRARARIYRPFLATKAGMARARASARFLSRGPHPGIVPALDAGEETDGSFVLVTPEAPGGDLARGPLPLAWPRAVRVAAAVADALGAAHARRVLHRDVTPSNILRGPDRVFWLADWDSARFPELDPDPRERAPLGTPGFMAPEQEYGDPLDPRADVFSLGMTLWTLLAGRPPVRDGTPAPERVALLTSGALPTLGRRSTPVDGLIAELAAPEPAERPADGTAAAALLRRALR